MKYIEEWCAENFGPTPWTQDVTLTYLRLSEDFQDFFWMYYVRLIYDLCQGVKFLFFMG